MTGCKLLGPTPPHQETPPKPYEMPIMNRDLEEVVYPQAEKYPAYGDTEAQAEYFAKVCLRRMPTKHCGILELHGVQTLLGKPGALRKAVEAARAAGYADAPDNREEVMSGKSHWGPSALLLASLSEDNPAWEKQLQENGFRLYDRFFNTIWDKDGNGVAKPGSLWGLILNEKARTGTGNWKEEPFFAQRALFLRGKVA